MTSAWLVSQSVGPSGRKYAQKAIYGLVEGASREPRGYAVSRFRMEGVRDKTAAWTRRDASPRFLRRGEEQKGGYAASSVNSKYRVIHFALISVKLFAGRGPGPGIAVPRCANGATLGSNVSC